MKDKANKIRYLSLNFKSLILILRPNSVYSLFLDILSSTNNHHVFLVVLCKFDLSVKSCLERRAV